MEARPEGLGEDEEAGEADGVGGVAEEQSGAIAGIGGGGVGGGGHVAVEEAGDLSGVTGYKGKSGDRNPAVRENPVTGIRR
ncbi:hypothetical protein ACLB2K_006670 [Fragaria x ananassa]